jgi:hypothetical protein
VDDHEDHGDERDGEDAYDRRLSDLLDTDADFLREQAMILLETGTVSIERPAGSVTAQFRPPRWHYRGILTWRWRPEVSVQAIRADGSGGSGASGPMVAKFDDRVNLVEEIAHGLALQLAALDE